MRLNYFINLILFLIPLNTFFLRPLNAYINSNSDNKVIELDLNYLNKLPANDYLLGPGDILAISVSRDIPELDNISKIDGEGTIYTPFLNRIYVEGLTINELNEILSKAYKKYVKYPDVEVQVKNYRPINVFIEGEVESPGLKTLQGSLTITNDQNSSFPRSNNLQSKNISYFPTVFDAIRESGGITQFSDLSNVELIRKNSLSKGGGLISTNLNLEKVLLIGDNSQNIRVYDSDIIKIRKSDNANQDILSKAIHSNINSKFINIYVTGLVNNPGSIQITKSATLNDAVDMAGGAKVVKGPVFFFRYNNDGTVEKRKFRLRRSSNRGSYKNPYLREGDMIFIGVSPLNVINETITELTSPFVGIYSTFSLIKAFNEL